MPKDLSHLHQMAVAHSLTVLLNSINYGYDVAQNMIGHTGKVGHINNGLMPILLLKYVFQQLVNLLLLN